MKFNINKLFLSVSHALDYLDIEFLDIDTYHSKRVAYIAVRIAKKLSLSNQELSNIFIYSLLHDIGLAESYFSLSNETKEYTKLSLEEKLSDHCDIGEEYFKNIDFIEYIPNIIKYHHEHYNGTGLYKLAGDEIPLYSQIIHLADSIANNFDLDNSTNENKSFIVNYVKYNQKFNPKLIDIFLEVSTTISFWLDVKEEYIVQALNRYIPDKNIKTSYKEIFNFTQLLSKLIDAKSGFTKDHSTELVNIAQQMCNFYKFNKDKEMKFLIATSLHDIGKLTIPNEILSKTESLTPNEFQKMKEHAYYTKLFLEDIDHFEDISRWASHHHERLDGSGYPFGLKDDQLSFEEQLIGCLDIYQALISQRPYKDKLSHDDSIEYLYTLANKNYINKNIVEDINTVFNQNS